MMFMNLIILEYIAVLFIYKNVHMEIIDTTKMKYSVICHVSRLDIFS